MKDCQTLIFFNCISLILIAVTFRRNYPNHHTTAIINQHGLETKNKSSVRLELVSLLPLNAYMRLLLYDLNQ